MIPDDVFIQAAERKKQLAKQKRQETLIHSRPNQRPAECGSFFFIEMPHDVRRMASSQQVFTVEERLTIIRRAENRYNANCMEGSQLKYHAFSSQVATTEGRGLDLKGCWQRVGRHGDTRWGFSLSYHGNCIRSFDMARKHNKSGGKWVRGPHKHKFSTSRIPRFAYKPDPPISVVEPNQSLIDFLVEANIAIPQNFQYIMFH